MAAFPLQPRILRRVWEGAEHPAGELPSLGLRHEGPERHHEPGFHGLIHDHPTRLAYTEESNPIEVDSESDDPTRFRCTKW